MTVLYDHQCFTGTTYGGVSRYFFDLMRVFSTRSDIQFRLSLLLSNNDYLRQQSFNRYWTYGRFAHNRRVNQAVSQINRQHSLQQLRAGKFDVFHPTYYHRYFLNAIGTKPFVLTFHDASTERFGDKYPELGRGLYETKKILLDRANAVIAVSEFTKQDILRYFSVDPAKIHVVPLSTSMSEKCLSVTNNPSVTAAQPYLLFVGKRDLYKNFDTFFRAIVPLFKRHPDLYLVCAGGGSFSSAEQAQFQSAGLSGRVRYAPIPDNDVLFDLYRQARAFVFPSLNEGFGIPVLEAFAGGCPAVLSDRSSLPEVAGNAAVFFDPDDTDAIGTAIDRVITDEPLRADLIQKGYRRLADFSAERTATQTLAVYQSLL
jgi:glycosyltransferase involved in cell wall biosynthesis